MKFPRAFLFSLTKSCPQGKQCYLTIQLRFYRSLTNFPDGSDSKTSIYNAGDPGSIPGLGRSPGEGNGNPLQDYCLEKSHGPMDRGAWQATVHGVTKSWTGLSNFTSLHFNQLSGQEIFNTNLPYTTMRGEENTQIQPQLAFHMEEEKYQTPESFSCFCLTKGKKSIKHV